MKRSAMTLLEVLLAVSISLVLALGIYQAIAMHYAQTESGRIKAARSQLVRGVLGQMQRDMRNVFTGWKPVSKDAGQQGDDSDNPNSDADEDPPESDSASSDRGESRTGTGSSGSSSSSLGSSSSSTSSTPSVTSATSQYEVPAGGVLGLPDAITLITRRTPAGLDFRSNQATNEGRPPVSDLRLVRYWYGSPGTETQDPRLGLVRQEIGYVPDVTAGDNPASGAKTELLAEEVRGLQVRYFDGTAWLTEWSQTAERPPQAIEITVALPKQFGSTPSPGAVPSLNPQGSAPFDPGAAGAEDLELLRIVVSSQDLAPPDDASAPASTPSTTSSASSPPPSSPSASAPTSSPGGTR